MQRFTAKIYSTLLLTLLFLSAPVIADKEEEFDYRQSVALILQTKNGGHILQRPDYDEPKNAFRIAFGAIDNYLGEMHREHSGLELDISSLVAEYSFILVNHENTKLFYLGDHWLGDGSSFAIMDHEDYVTIKDVFDSTNRHRNDETPKNFLDNYIKNIQQLWQQDTEEYFREYHFPERGNTSPVDSIPSNKPIIRTNKSTNFSSNQTSNNEPLRLILESKRQKTTESKTPIVSNSLMKETLSDNSFNTENTEKDLNAEQTASIKTTHLFWTLGLIVLLLIGYLWWKGRT